jgi:long-chain acyl-CoA synthetase
MPSFDQTLGQLIDLAASHFQVKAADLNPDDDFFKKLKINSLQALDLLTRLESHFNIELPDYELQGVTDFGPSPIGFKRDCDQPPGSDLSSYSSLGEVLRGALEKWQEHLSLIEADRDRENCGSLTEPRRLRNHRFHSAIVWICRSRPRCHHHVQPVKWLTAHAVFYSGGVLVPIDFKPTAAEHLAPSLTPSQVLIVEFPIWRALTKARGSPAFLAWGLVTKLRNADLKEPNAGNNAIALPPRFVARRRTDLACIVYSSGTGGRPKGCMLTHHNYLEQCQSLMSWYPFWPGVRYLSILPTNHAIDFMVGFIGPFVCGATVVHLRTLRPEYLKEAFRFKITYASFPWS